MPENLELIESQPQSKLNQHIEGSDGEGWPGIDERVWPILDMMWTGSPFTVACKELHIMPQRAWRWIQKGGQHSRRTYEDARRACARAMAGETITIADRCRLEAGADPVRAAQAGINSRQWLAAKEDPSTYGDHVQERSGAGGDGQQRVTVAITQLFGIVESAVSVGTEHPLIFNDLQRVEQSSAAITDVNASTTTE
jgi:hypothetical protein